VILGSGSQANLGRKSDHLHVRPLAPNTRSALSDPLPPQRLLKQLDVDGAAFGGIIGVGLWDLDGLEVEIAFDAKTGGTAHGFEFGKPHAAKLRKALAEIAKAESDVRLFWIEFGRRMAGALVCVSAALHESRVRTWFTKSTSAPLCSSGARYSWS
jgi:hypothetical protein